jgi:hypothetical protein
MSLVPSNLQSRLEESGWYPGRRVAVDSRVTVSHPAYLVLAELSGLQLYRFYDSYEACEVDFQFVSEKLDLTERWEAELGTELIGFAEHHNGHGELLISATGLVFGGGLVGPGFWFVGGTIQEALVNLMIGIPFRPMLLETDTSVTLYGRTYTRADPEVLHAMSPELR